MESFSSQAKTSKETFGLSTSNSPPPIKELKPLQDGLCEVARNLQFREVNDQFQKELKDDLKTIKNDKKVIVAADKTINFYKMEKENYKELLNNNVTKDYKKTDAKTVDDISKNDKKVAVKLEVADRMYCTSKRDCFITFL